MLPLVCKMKGASEVIPGRDSVQQMLLAGMGASVAIATLALVDIGSYTLHELRANEQELMR